MQNIDCIYFNTGCSLIVKNNLVSTAPLSGSCPYVQYLETEYYVSFAYVTDRLRGYQSGADDCIIYRPVLNVIKIGNEESNMPLRTVYTSEPIDFDEQIFKKFINFTEFNRKTDYCREFKALKINSIASWNYEDDEVEVVGEVNNKNNFVAKIEGLGKVVNEIIRADQAYMLDYDKLCNEKHFTDYISEKYYYLVV